MIMFLSRQGRLFNSSNDLRHRARHIVSKESYDIRLPRSGGRDC